MIDSSYTYHNYQKELNISVLKKKNEKNLIQNLNNMVYHSSRKNITKQKRLEPRYLIQRSFNNSQGVQTQAPTSWQGPEAALVSTLLPGLHDHLKGLEWVVIWAADVHQSRQPQCTPTQRATRTGWKWDLLTAESFSFIF